MLRSIHVLLDTSVQNTNSLAVKAMVSKVVADSICVTLPHDTAAEGVPVSIRCWGEERQWGRGDKYIPHNKDGQDKWSNFIFFKTSILLYNASFI